MATRLPLQAAARALRTIEAFSRKRKRSATVCLLHVAKLALEPYTFGTYKPARFRHRYLTAVGHDFGGYEQHIFILAQFRLPVMAEGWTGPAASVIGTLTAGLHESFGIPKPTGILVGGDAARIIARDICH